MKESSIMRTGLHYGSFSGASMFAFYMLLHLTGANIFSEVSLLGVWIPVVFIVLATRHQRDHLQEGQIRYGQAFATGLATAFFGATLFGLAFYLMGKIYDPTLIDAYKLQAEASMEEGKKLLSDSLVDKALESIDLVTMESLAFSEAFNKMLWGGVVSLVSAGVMKRQFLA